MYYVTRTKVVSDDSIFEKYIVVERWHVVFKNRAKLHRLRKPAFCRYSEKSGKVKTFCEIWYVFGGCYVKKQNCLILSSINRDLENKLPTVIYENGTKEWWRHKDTAWERKRELHRDNGPAVEYSNGDKEWWFFGKRHRLDGPAVVYGNKQYFYELGEFIND
ncbi:MAG: hypothetical protein EKK64_06785 [Neisseriaceae bacterium]|nr:MAG: hypothetical protein EKK64_06785 [Neisseriaceae bacterium]